MKREEFDKAVVAKEDIDFASDIFSVFEANEGDITLGMLTILFGGGKKEESEYTEDQINKAEKAIELIDKALDFYTDHLCDEFEELFDKEESEDNE